MRRYVVIVSLAFWLVIGSPWRVSAKEFTGDEVEHIKQLLGEHPEAAYYDPALPKDVSAIPMAPYEGEHYEAVIPDTLERAVGNFGAPGCCQGNMSRGILNGVNGAVLMLAGWERKTW